METFDSIVLSGGGVKSIAHLGVLQYHYECETLDLSKIEDYAASSAGSLICILLACGYTPMEIFQEVYKMKEFIKPADFNLWGFFENYGLLKMDTLIDKIEQLVTAKLGKVPSLKEFKEMTGKNIIVSVGNVSKTRLEYFTPATTPDIKVTDVVKFACNIPGVFVRAIYNGDNYADGGLLDNFPIFQIPSHKQRRILGVIATGSDLTKDTDIMGYMYKVMMMPINMVTSLRVDAFLRERRDNVRLVTVKISDVQLVATSMSPDVKMQLFMKGYKEAELDMNKKYFYVRGWKI